jgi:hypothetical protein
MRTTLNIDDELMAKVKRKARESGKTITDIVEEALRKETAGDVPDRSRFKLKWRTVAGRLRRGVELADRDSLYQIMEKPE